MRYFLIAGEPSGDLHGASLMRSIQLLDPSADFSFFGGDLMVKAGNKKPVIHIRDLAFMGFTQLVNQTSRIVTAFRTCKKAIAEHDPHVVIPIDYGGFNLRMIRWLRKRDYKTAYYITPKVWAWMPSRARTLAKSATISLCVLPFEEEFLKIYGVACKYVGNPVKDYTRSILDIDPRTLAGSLSLNRKPVIALLPGSRRQEIEGLLPVMAAVRPHFPAYEFVVAGHPNFPESFYKDICKDSRLRVCYDKTLELLRISAAALVTSGTATLEAALMGTPQVVCYKTAPVSYLIARMVIRVRYISLVNLILGQSCVDELIQHKCSPDKVKEKLNLILTDKEYCQKILTGYTLLDDQLGDSNAPDSAAAIIFRLATEPR